MTSRKSVNSIQKSNKPKVNPIDKLSSLVQNHNDIIYANDMNDQTIDYKDYFDKNSPSFLDGNQSVGEENKYVQNRIWKLQGDKRYVPDYEDVQGFDDEKYEKYMTDIIMGSITPKQKKPVVKSNKLDKMNDSNFTKYLDKQ